MKSYIHKPLEQRFWEKVDVRSPDECWEWIGAKDKQGYGEFYGFKKKIRAHKISWILNCGTIPSHDSYHGLCVLHHCDNPACVNPNHLFLGTHGDNMKDRDEKGRNNHRFLYGKDHPQHGTNSKFSKLTENDVRKIRELRKSGQYKLRELGEMFGVSLGLINNICQGRKWAWLEK